MSDPHDAGPSDAYARAEAALDALLARYARRIQQKRRAAPTDSEATEQMLAERRELLADKHRMEEMSEEQLVQVAAIYEARNENWDSDVPDGK
ncbi:hypothetical protein ABZS88_40065 [Streptomyces sp. NPDC005480]|uniref:hypothetical protein n=1 Tax=Streptomyces sp. NPDC005480 TaxID=3154880 RepID=UPI0033AC9D51